MSGSRLTFRLSLGLALLLGGLALASRASAQLPSCDTFCNCTRACYVNNCQINGFALSCGDWGICQFSCYCGGDCSTTGGGGSSSLATVFAPPAPAGRAAGRSGACRAPSPADALLASIFG